MIGLQEYIINNNIKVYEFAKEINMSASAVWRWIHLNKVPDKYHDIICDKLNIDKDYINKVVNNVNTYQPRNKGFNAYKICDNIIIIYLERKDGSIWETIIDTDDLEKLKVLNYSWHVGYAHCNKEYYVMATIYYTDENKRKKSTTKNLNSIIMNVPSGYHVDHINHNPLDNRKENLRILPNCNNSKNRKSKNSNNKSGYRNVCWIRNQWCVQLQINGKNKRLGFFDDVEEAGKFAEEMREKYYGEFKGAS